MASENNSGGLVLVGLGLWDGSGLTLGGLETLKGCQRVFAEFYTGALPGVEIDELERVVGKKIEVLKRADVEDGKVLIESAKDVKTALLVQGDPMSATTHVSLAMMAFDKDVVFEVVHGPSALTAIPGLLGLSHYKFGRSTTLVTPEGDYAPSSPLEVVRENKDNGLHTLVLLDIKDDQLMSANEGFKMISSIQVKTDVVIKDDDIVCVVGQAGSKDPTVLAGEFKEMVGKEFGPTPHTIVVPGVLHFMEAEALVKLARGPPRLLL